MKFWNDDVAIPQVLEKGRNYYVKTVKVDSYFNNIYLATTPETQIHEILDTETPEEPVKVIGISEENGV